MWKWRRPKRKWCLHERISRVCQKTWPQLTTSSRSASMFDVPTLRRWSCFLYYLHRAHAYATPGAAERTPGWRSDIESDIRAILPVSISRMLNCCIPSKFNTVDESFWFYFHLYIPGRTILFCYICPIWICCMFCHTFQYPDSLCTNALGSYLPWQITCGSAGPTFQIKYCTFHHQYFIKNYKKKS